MNSQDLIREGTGGTPVQPPAAGRARRSSRRSARSPYSAFALKGVRRFERNKSAYAPFRIY